MHKTDEDENGHSLVTLSEGDIDSLAYCDDEDEKDDENYYGIQESSAVDLINEHKLKVMQKYKSKKLKKRLSARNVDPHIPVFIDGTPQQNS